MTYWAIQDIEQEVTEVTEKGIKKPRRHDGHDVKDEHDVKRKIGEDRDGLMLFRQLVVFLRFRVRGDCGPQGVDIG